MLKLHMANKNYSSWSLRPWAVLKAFNVPFEEIMHPLPEDGAWAEYRKFSPSGKVPCLVDGNTVVWDSLAIVEYLAESVPHIWPHDKTARAWARCAAAEMHSGFQTLRNTCGMSCGHRIELAEITPVLHKDINRIDELWSQGLQTFGGPFLAGKEFTAVDAFFAPVVFRAQTYGLPLSPASVAYVTHLLNYSALQEWYQVALLETWREPGHEHEVLDAGRVLQDLRAKPE